MSELILASFQPAGPFTGLQRKCRSEEGGRRWCRTSLRQQHQTCEPRCWPDPRGTFRSTEAILGGPSGPRPLGPVRQTGPGLSEGRCQGRSRPAASASPPSPHRKASSLKAFPSANDPAQAAASAALPRRGVAGRGCSAATGRQMAAAPQAAGRGGCLCGRAGRRGCAWFSRGLYLRFRLLTRRHPVPPYPPRPTSGAPRARLGGAAGPQDPHGSLRPAALPRPSFHRGGGPGWAAAPFALGAVCSRVGWRRAGGLGFLFPVGGCAVGHPPYPRCPPTPLRCSRPPRWLPPCAVPPWAGGSWGPGCPAEGVGACGLVAPGWGWRWGRGRGTPGLARCSGCWLPRPGISGLIDGQRRVRALRWVGDGWEVNCGEYGGLPVEHPKRDQKEGLARQP